MIFKVQLLYLILKQMGKNLERKVTDCEHIFKKSTNCLLCGVYEHRNQAIKTTAFSNSSHLPAKQFLNHMNKRCCDVINAKDISDGTSVLLSAICEKFSFGSETLALGLYIFQKLSSMNPNERFWASTCLIVAGKGIELDKNVPYLNRFQRYADKSFTQEEYQSAEKLILESMSFDIQYSTFMSYINFYLTNGVIFKQDNLNAALVEYVQDDVISKARQILRKGSFLKYKQDQLACAIIKETREKYRLSGWTQQLEKVTNISIGQIVIIQELIILKVSKEDSNVSHKILNMKNICVRKKYEDFHMNDYRCDLSKKNNFSSYNTKENSLSTCQPSIISNKNVKLSILNHSEKFNMDHLPTKRRL